MSTAQASGVESSTNGTVSRSRANGSSNGVTKERLANGEANGEANGDTGPRQPDGGSNADADADADAEATEQMRKSFRRKYRHVVAVHSVARPSCLSHDATDPQSFIGFRNLMVIVLVAGNVRLMIENIQKYGVLVCIGCHDFRAKDVKLGLALYFLIPCHLLVAYLIELISARQALVSRQHAERKKGGKGGTTSPTQTERERFQAMWKLVWMAHAVNVTLALAVNTFIVYYYIHHPLIGTLTIAHAIIVWLKTASYAFTNRDLRHAYLHPVKGELDALPPIYKRCPYPANITFGNLAYFWWAPTLVYQPAYPRSERFRREFLLKRIGEVVCLTVFMWFCSAQYASPLLRNSLDKMSAWDMFGTLERLLKLSTISLVIWLAGFFALFQSFLNALAEITRFGDRDFYEAWWNSGSVGTYWRTWNKPIHQFFRRHVYSPMRSRGWSHKAASFVVFLISALLHELLVGVPTHNLIGVAFAGMLFQLPLIALTMPMEKKNTPNWKIAGNVVFWVSFTIFGQPFAALCYFYAWQAKYGSVSRMMDASGATNGTAVCPPTILG